MHTLNLFTNKFLFNLSALWEIIIPMQNFLLFTELHMYSLRPQTVVSIMAVIDIKLVGLWRQT